jgi:predicted ATPase/DNA-binding SARP family transcriptional activator
METLAQLRVHLLGGFRVFFGDQPVPDTAWRQKRAATIIKLLALEPSHRLHHEQVMDILWPNHDLDAQRNNLHVVSHYARRALASAGAPRPAFLTRDGDMLVLGPAGAVWVDLDAFEQAVAASWRTDELVVVQRAIDLYAGDLLPEDPYEEWLEHRRTTARTSYLALLTRFGRLLAERGDVNRAVGVFQQLVALEATQEEAHVALMRLYALAGQRSQALAQYERLVDALYRELDAEPERATRELADAIRDRRYPETSQPLVPEHILASAAATPAQSCLPALVSDLIGREREIAEIRQALSTTRLVTLTGPGGVGKTRLGIATAHAIADTFPDGVAFVDLAPLREPRLVVSAVAGALGVREAGGQPLIEAVKAHLRDRRLLLVLDNYEHVVDAATIVTQLLEHAPVLKVIVTSRMRLRLRGEHEYPVPPLALPSTRQQPSVECLSRCAAIALFVERAREVAPGFTLTPANATAVADICGYLDGLPLAIELAAARIKVLSPEAMRARLAQPLALLSDGPRDAPERQQTLRNAIRWSYDLLGPDEQRLFRQLSVFAGSWTMSAAEALTGWDGQCRTTPRRTRASSTSGHAIPVPNSVTDPAVLDALVALVDKNLVTRRAEPDGSLRFGMLETIREFGREQIRLSGEAPAVQKQLATYLLALAEDGRKDVEGPNHQRWLDEMERERDNLSAALHVTIECLPGDLGLRLATALYGFWYIRGPLSDAEVWIERAITRGAEAPHALRARALYQGGELARVRGDYRRATCLARQSLALSEQSGDAAGIASASFLLGNIASSEGRYACAVERFDEALRRYRALDNPDRVAFVLNNYGQALRRQGDVARAMTMFEEARALWGALDSGWGVTVASVSLAEAAYDCGELPRARRLFQASLRYYRDIDDKWGIADCLHGLGAIAAAFGQPDRAVTLMAAAELLCEVTGVVDSPDERARNYDILAAAAATLGAAAHDAAWQRGWEAALDDTIAQALESVVDAEADRRRTHVRARDRGGLTLVWRGDTSDELAS